MHSYQNVFSLADQSAHLLILVSIAICIFLQSRPPDVALLFHIIRNLIYSLRSFKLPRTFSPSLRLNLWTCVFPFVALLAILWTKLSNCSIKFAASGDFSLSVSCVDAPSWLESVNPRLNDGTPGSILGT